MTDQQNLGALLAALTGQQQRPSQNPHPSTMHAQLAQNLAAAAAGLGGSQQHPPTSQIQTNFALPQPTSSGALDLSNIKPANSGTVSLAEAIARAKSIAAERGVSAATYRNEKQAPRYDDIRSTRGGGGGVGGGGGGGGGGGNGSSYGRGRSRSRSCSPPRRDTYRDGYNPYRDERRGRNFERERSYSPPRRGGPYSPPPARAYGLGQGSGQAGRGGPLGSGGGGGGGTGRDKNIDTHTEQMHIESGLVGLIIGRGGETLRRVEQETGARVQFLTGADHRDTPERLCNIIGSRPQIAAARQQILQIIEDNAKGSGSNAGGSGGPSKRNPSSASSHQPPLRDGEDNLQIMVPDRTVGLIIGRGGETIRDLQERSGCHINIVGEQKSINGLRPVNLIGSAESAKRAKDLIMEIVDSDIRSQATPGGPSQGATSSNSGARERGHGNVQETIRVPIDAVGMIIGKGGETIKEMQSSTGCRINVSSQFHPSDTEREISLQGPKDAITRARKAIEDKVEASHKKQHGGGGGSGDRQHNTDRDRDRGGHHDYSNSTTDRYAQQQPMQGPQQGVQQPSVPGQVGPTPGDASADPYAPWGGYQSYVAMYYAMIASQQAGGAPGTGTGAPGTT